MHHRKERRRPEPPDPEQLSEGLNPAQLRTLSTLHHFHWKLRFVRRPMFRDPVPVLFDRENNRYVTIEPDGSVNETPDLVLREAPRRTQ